MNSIKQLDQLTLLYGKPINFHDICMIYPATIGDIASIGKNNFYQYLYLLTSDPKSLYKLSQELDINTFKFLLIQTNVSSQFLDLVKKAFRFFIRQQVSFLLDLQVIQIGELQQGRMITETDYEQFMAFLKKMYKVSSQRQYHAEDSRAQSIIEKLKQGSQEVRKIKAKNGTDDEIDIDSMVSSLGLYYQNINIIWDLPYYTFFDQVSRLQLKESYDNNIVFSAAGAKIPKDKMKYWICKVQDTKGG